MPYVCVELVGLIAGICTTVAFLPQIIKILKTKHVKDISLGMYIIMTSGIFLWMVYGILLGRIPIIFANGISFVLCFMVILAKIRYEG